MFSDMNMFHVSDILKKKMLSNSLLKENISFKCFLHFFHAQHGYQLVKNLLNSQLNHFEFESAG